jgi:hypothetical protein
VFAEEYLKKDTHQVADLGGRSQEIAPANLARKTSDCWQAEARKKNNPVQLIEETPNPVVAPTGVASVIL